MSMHTFHMAVEEKTLTGEKRLALLAIGDCQGAATVKSVAEWCNCNDQRALNIIHALESDGWLTEGYHPGLEQDTLIQPQMLSYLSNEKGWWPATQIRPTQRNDSGWPVSKKLRAEIYERDGSKCHYCGSTQRLTLDHIVPQNVGGDHKKDNLVTCCKSCNSAKGTKQYLEYWASLS